MAYAKQSWENTPSTNTPISAARLGYMEDGIEEAAATADEALDSRLDKTANLADLTNAATARTSLGLGNSATRDVGTSSAQVAQGDHTHSVGVALDETAGDARYARRANNLSDLASAATARANLGLTDAVVRSEVIMVALSDETTAITTGTAKLTMRMPWAMTLTAVRASLTTASSSGIPTVDINEAGTTILSTKLTIDANETTSTTAATPAVISDTALADDAEVTFDIDTAGTGAKGLKVYLIGYRT